jgi:hypothetical protein
MATPTVVRAGLFALAIVALGFVPGVLGANSPSAKGKGDFIRNGFVRTFSFHAIQHHNGVVTGQAKLRIRAIGTFVDMAIDCLSIDPLFPNTAFLGGPITKSNVPGLPVGQKAIFEAQDNGEGTKDNRESRDSPPDRLSLLFLAGTLDCTQKPPLGLIDLQHGHIKVRLGKAAGDKGSDEADDDEKGEYEGEHQGKDNHKADDD